MPHALELPGMLRAIVELMSGKGLAGRVRSVVDELVARGSWRAGRWWFSRRRTRLVPGLAAVVRALNDLPEPPTRLGCIQPVRIGRRSLHVIHLPAREVRAAYVPLLTLAIRCEDECALASPHQNSYFAHRSLPWCLASLLSSLVAKLNASIRAALLICVSRSVGPLGDRNQEHGQSILSVARCQNRGAWQICSPGYSIRLWDEEHQVRMPVPVAIAQVRLP